MLIEHHDEWQDTDRRYLSEASMRLVFPSPPIPLPVPTKDQKQPIPTPTAENETLRPPRERSR